MLIEDLTYGRFEVDEPVLVDLICSRPVQRLKRIHQAGAAYLVRSGRDVSRYEHCVGTMLLVRVMGGSLEEQVAALLHDVSHTAFSHVVDRVLENGSDDYHERFFGQIVAESEIPSMLERHGIELTRILKPKSWPILERVLGKARAGIRVRVLEGVVP